MSTQFELFTSLRSDARLKMTPETGPDVAGFNYIKSSSLYMLDYHRDRLLRAATHWDWTAAMAKLEGDEGLQYLSDYIESAIADRGDPLYVKVLLASDGQMSLQSSVIPAVPLPNLFPRRLPPPGAPLAEGDPSRANIFDVVLDMETTARSEYTHFKTTKRDVYDSARARAGLNIKDKKEVLLANHSSGSVMEGSITTPWFWRGGRWVTPPVPTPFSLEEGTGGQDGTTRRWALERGLAVEEIVHVSSLVQGEECWISNGVKGFVHGRILLAAQA